MRSKLFAGMSAVLLMAMLAGCKSSGSHNGFTSDTSAGEPNPRKGDEIMIAGQMFHTGAPVVLWMDPGGFDAYRTERRFTPWDKADYFATTQETKMDKEKVYQPARLGLRQSSLTPAEIAKVRGGGWPLEMLQEKIDQFVYHFDVTGTSSQCFFILHDARGLSVHFMLDCDGTIYQTCDVKESAWHATKSNGRSVGIEIANIGAYTPNSKDNPLPDWYRKDKNGRTTLVLPKFVMKQPLHTPKFVGHPARNEKITGEIQGRTMEMYDLTPQQYDSLTKLTATLCTVLPKITCDYPRDKDGKVIPHALGDDEWKDYQGLMGHYHVQKNKTDPGPAFDWDKVQGGAWKLMSEDARKANEAQRGHPVRRAPATQPVAAMN